MHKFHPTRLTVPTALLVGAILLLVGACEEFEPPIERDLNVILERDTLFALITYNSTSYFLYRGQPMGFEYELLRNFAEDHELVFRPIIVRDRDTLYASLNRGIGDVAAGRLIPGARDTGNVTFTNPLYQTAPTVVQQTAPFDSADVPEPVTDVLEEHEEIPEPVEAEVRRIDAPADLAGAEVTISGSSGFYDRLIELSDSLTGDIEVVELGGSVAPESLIQGVSHGYVDLTVQQENIAKLTGSYYDNISIQPTVGPPRQVAWAVRENAPNLLAALNEWLERHRETEAFRSLYEKYYVDRRGYEERARDEYLTSRTGRLSDYDPLLKRHASSIGWDWLLLASQTYQESLFNPRARSWAGAMGLLQLMPPTARQYGVANAYDPEENVAGAVRFLKWLTEYWAERIQDEDEQLRFTLASYNTGHGHVEDARRLAEKHGDTPEVWEDVAFWLLQKSKREYYTDPVVKYGFCRGLEPVTYVVKILDRFEHYKQFVIEDATA